MYGLGRKRSKYGKCCESLGINQQAIVKTSNLNKETVSRLFVENDGTFRGITKNEALRALNKLSGKKFKESDFWT